VGAETGVLIEAVVDEPPAVTLPEPARERLPGGVLDEKDDVAETFPLRERLDPPLGLGERLPLERAIVEVEVVLARERDLEDALGQRPDLGVPVEAQEGGLQVEDTVPVFGEPRQQLLRALEAESPFDDGKAENVEACGAAQGPYLAT
jgi:hypothetical protein